MEQPSSSYQGEVRKSTRKRIPTTKHLVYRSSSSNNPSVVDCKPKRTNPKRGSSNANNGKNICNNYQDIQTDDEGNPINSSNDDDDDDEDDGKSKAKIPCKSYCSSISGSIGGTATTATAHTTTSKVIGKNVSEKKPVVMSRVSLLVKKTYDRVRRCRNMKRVSDLKIRWTENAKKIDEDHREHADLKSKALHFALPQSVRPLDDDLVDSFQSVTSQTERAADEVTIKLFSPETFNRKTLKFTVPQSTIKSPVITIPSLEQIPPVLSWTSVPYNLHEDDGKFLTNIPFLGDDIIDKDKKFIDDMVNLYQGKIHGITPQGMKRVQMEDDVFYDLVGALMDLEAEKGSEIFSEEFHIFGKTVGKEVTTPTAGSSTVVEVKVEGEGDGKNEEDKTEVPSDIETGGVAKGLPMSAEGTRVPSACLVEAISKAFPGIGTAEELRDRYESVTRKKRHEEVTKLPILSNGIEQQNPADYSIPNLEGSYARDLPKEATMHAYQVLFCRRCFQYDCTRGHNGDDQVDLNYYKQNRSVPNTVNFTCNNQSCWLLDEIAGAKTEIRTKEDILAEWTPGDKSMFRCLIDSFQSYCYVASLMLNKTCRQVNEYAKLENAPTENSSCNASGGGSLQKPGVKRRPKPWNKKSSSSISKKNLARRWINNVKRSEKSIGGIKTGGVLPPRFMPCKHKAGQEECDEKNPHCYCGNNGTSCEKFCTCPPTCKRRFPGCRCTSTCDSKRCVCFFAARECDPDLCTGCGANEHAISKVTCRNVNIQRRLHKHLLMGKSDVAGWGIFIKEDAQKGEFIAEYRGEVISHDESERRGHVYDKIQHTYLFELNDHFVVDATRKGNKARFVNSSKNPNCEVKRMLVNGDHRIGIYAKRYIESGEELFYDYEDEKQQKVAAATATVTTAPLATSSSHKHHRQ